MAQTIDHEVFESLLPSTPSPCPLSEEPEPIPTIKAKDDKKKRQPPEEVQENPFSRQGISISLFLK
jgi:hypothetical protein